MRRLLPLCCILVLSSAVFGQDADVPTLAKQLKDADPYVRLKAAKVLGLMGGKAKDALPDLKEVAVADPDEDVREFAKRSIGQIGADVLDPKATAYVKELRNKGTPGKNRLAALDKLGKMGAEAKAADAAIVESIVLAHPNYRDEHLEALSKVHPELAKHVVTLMVDQLRPREAILGIRELKESGKAALPLLIFYYTSSYPIVAKDTSSKTGSGVIATTTDAMASCLQTAPVIAPDDYRTIAFLVGALTYKPAVSPVIERRMSTLRSAALRGCQNAKASPALVQAIASALQDRIVTADAATELGRIGPLAKTALPVLNKLKFDESAIIRDAVAKAIEQIEK